MREDIVMRRRWRLCTQAHVKVAFNNSNHHCELWRNRSPAAKSMDVVWLPNSLRRAKMKRSSFLEGFIYFFLIFIRRAIGATHTPKTFLVLRNNFFLFFFLPFFFSFGTFWCTCQQLVYQIHHTLTHTHYRKSISFSSSAAAILLRCSSGHHRSCWMNFFLFFFPRVSFVIFWSRHRIEMWG